jgi:hypothetical protein
MQDSVEKLGETMSKLDRNLTRDSQKRAGRGCQAEQGFRSSLNPFPIGNLAFLTGALSLLFSE